MFHRSFALITALFVFSTLADAQQKTVPTPTSAPPSAPATPQNASEKPAPATAPRPRRARQTMLAKSAMGADLPSAEGAIAAFEALVSGIERSDIDAVMSLYWNSPELTIFNNNGTITRTWDQLRANRASAYPDAEDVKLDIRNRNVHMIGRDGAVISCQWAQTQLFRGKPESAAGRLTVILRRIDSSWKIVHTHTSPDAPDSTRLMTSERITETPQPQTKPQERRER
ncbi:MAG: nuclear transport factor 2 family protein [Pyrinomonadaceae bacterium]